jgi:hypothetical protein
MILQQNTDIVKVEHNVDILNEDDSSDRNSGDIYIPSAYSIAKAKPEVSCFQMIFMIITYVLVCP